MARRKKGRAVNGWLVLDKPIGMTSTQAVSVAKRLFDARKAGHAGTLDPLATGILPIAFGEATKTVNFAVDSAKGYRFTVQWGAETTTDDAEGEATATSDARPTLDQIEALLPGFIGDIQQVPPQFSAIKVDGQRAYDLARDGEAVALQARDVFIEDLRVADMPSDDHTILEADCGKGTYVRALARDLGRKLGCYGHVVELRRTRVGGFTVDESVTLDDLRASQEEDEADPAGGVARAYLRPVSEALKGITELSISDADAGRLKRGQSILMRGRDAPIAGGVAFATVKGDLIALGELANGEFIPTRVFNL